MYQPFLRFRNVSYSYPGSISSAVSSVSLSFGAGWTAFAGPNGSGKTTLLKLATALLHPDTGSIVSSGSAVYCAQRTDCAPENANSFLLDWSKESIKLRDTLQIGDDWGERWNTLSHGERKRFQIAVALWGRPAVLALDEPFNHLDIHGRTLLRESMLSYEGCGLLVSHDRHAMDSICSNCVLFLPEGVQLFKCGYSGAVKVDTAHQKNLCNQYREAKSDYARLKRDARKKMLKARTIQAHASGRNISFKDICKTNCDGPSRVDGIVQKAGQRSREASARADRARKQMESISCRKMYNSGIQLNGEHSSRNHLLKIQSDEVTAGKKTITYPDLEIHTRSRIALTGRNGSGKTLFLNHIRPMLNCPPDKLLWIPQEITAEQSSICLSEAKSTSKENLGKIMTIARRLGSDPKRILTSAVPSPGETRKLLLALGLSKTPWLVVMDEPTNHMDLPSVECLERALEDYRGALLLVSHDLVFLKQTTDKSWKIECDKLSLTC